MLLQNNIGRLYINARVVSVCSRLFRIELYLENDIHYIHYNMRNFFISNGVHLSTYCSRLHAILKSSCVLAPADEGAPNPFLVERQCVAMDPPADGKACRTSTNSLGYTVTTCQCYGDLCNAFGPGLLRSKWLTNVVFAHTCKLGYTLYNVASLLRKYLISCLAKDCTYILSFILLYIYMAYLYET